MYPGADPGLQVRGGALKKIAPSGGRREQFWGISCEKSRFYAKNSYFFPIAEGGTKIFGVLHVKNHDFTPKIHIFSNCGGRHKNFWGISCEKSQFYGKFFFPILGGARAGCTPSPGSAPGKFDVGI
jgi:hypothetical protein